MELRELQKLTLTVMPQWHYRMVRPFKKLICDGISPEMYYALRNMVIRGVSMTMTEFARTAHMPKQQATRVVDRLIKAGLVRRVDDPNDRRVVRLEPTRQATEYLQRFTDEEAAYYRDLYAAMEEDDRERFGQALQTIHEIFNKLPCQCSREKEESHD